MASDLIGSLRVALGLDTAKFEAGATKARSTARGLSTDLQSSFKLAKTAVEGLIAAFAVGALADQIKQSLDYAASISTVASTLGVTTKQLQEFRYAAGQVGVSQEALDTGIKRLAVSIGKAEVGSSAQIKAFNAIGISVDQLRGKNPADVFKLIADGLQGVTDRSQRAAIEVALFGRTGADLDSLLSGGSKQINALSQAAEQLGIVIGPDLIANAETAKVKLGALETVLTAEISSTVAQNADSIITLANALIQLAGTIGPALQGWRQFIAEFKAGAPALALGTAGLGLYGKLADQGAEDQKIKDFFADPRHNRPLNSDSLYNTAKVPTGRDLPQFLASKPKKPKKARTPQDRTEQDQFEFAQQQRQIDQQILEAKKSLSHDVSDQAEISLAILAIDQQIKDAEIDHKVAQAQRDFAAGKITKSTLNQVTAEAAIEKGKDAELTELQRKAILDERDQQLLQQSIELDEHAYDAQKSLLQKQADLAQTASDRRTVQLQLLDLDYKEKRIMLQRIIAESNDPIAVANARVDLANLPANYLLDQQSVIQQTRGPLEDYIAKLPDTVAKFNEAVQTLEVQGIDGLLDDITQLQGGFKSLLKALLNTALQFAQGFAKLELQKGLSPLLGSLLGGGQSFLSSGAGNNLFGDLSNIPLGVGNIAAIPDTIPSNGAIAGLLNFAKGGSFTIGGLPGVDKNVLSLNSLPIGNVSLGERVTIGNDNSPAPMGRSGPQVAMTVVTPNADSFSRSNRQVVRQLKRTLR